MNPIERINHYLEPDPVWGMLGATTQKQFVEKFITTGKFHKDVPEKIKQDYISVERLQFYSYYSFQLMDEAFGKSTRIFEASVDLRISNLKIEKKGFESLNSKIKRLEEFSSNELHEKWLQAKELRNIFAHHKAGRVMGIVILNAFKHNLNMINSIFLDHKEILNREDTLKNLKNKSVHLKSGLFVLEYQSKRYLIWSIIPYSAVSHNTEISLWVCHPVYGKKSIETVGSFPDPFLFNLKNLKFNSNGLDATIADNNEEIKITKTTNETDIQAYENHKSQMINIDLELKTVYWAVLENNINKAVTEFIHRYAWE